MLICSDVAKEKQPARCYISARKQRLLWFFFLFLTLTFDISKGTIFSEDYIIENYVIEMQFTKRGISDWPKVKASWQGIQSLFGSVLNAQINTSEF